jgi:hypothetical protein
LPRTSLKIAEKLETGVIHVVCVTHARATDFGETLQVCQDHQLDKLHLFSQLKDLHFAKGHM